MKPLALAILVLALAAVAVIAKRPPRREYPLLWEPGPRGTGHSRRYVEPDDGVLPTDPRTWTLAAAEGRVQWVDRGGRPVF